ncbi:MAG: NUDIX hydrolase [Pseudomonadota bacterium]
MPVKPWKIVSSIRDRSYRVFSLRTDRAISPRTGKEHHFFILESSSWVNVIPLTPKREVVMVRQYRHGTQNATLEIPGGLVEESETPEKSARRELFEETGYRAEQTIFLGAVHPNPAIQNNECYTFLAKDVVLAGRQEQDEREDIEVLLRPLSEIPRLIREGEITHSLVLAAFYRFFMEYQPYHLPSTDLRLDCQP